MTQHAGGSDEWRGLSPSAASAIASAEREARGLGHDRVGTEHLLLGLLTSDDNTSGMLTAAGVTVAATRNKVTEAFGPPVVRTTGVDVDAALPRTARAGRAIGRAARFAHAAGSDIVDSDHVLLGVLDVEGTAGQVLRGLGIDVDSLRDQLEAPHTERDRAPREHTRTRVRSVDCPACGVPLSDTLSSQVVTATAEAGPERAAVLFSCGNCGRFLGVAPA